MVLAKIGKKIVRFIKMLVLMLLILVGSLFTPIFAEVGGALLSAFSRLTLDTPTNPAVIVVVGGGLTQKNGEIVLNHYSQSRAETVIELSRQHPLPIVTSGAESPWLAEHIKSTLTNAVIVSDNASMNTCENAVFSAKLMAHHELPSEVYLVTDRYHMARTRRQFAQAGIATTPYPAPLAITPTWDIYEHWHDNWVHSRRTAYELIALARDIFRPQDNCRSADKISIETIETPRKQPKIFVYRPSSTYQ